MDGEAFVPEANRRALARGGADARVKTPNEEAFTLEAKRRASARR